MDIPGVADAMADPYLRGKADEEAEKLLEELKKSVKADIKDVGVLRKELHITVPRKVIDEFLTHNIDELLHDAIVPGFRKGRAPRKLVEKRFGSEVRDSLKTMVLGQSYFAVVENNKLEVLGDPVIQVTTGDQKKFVGVDEAMGQLKLPDGGDFEYVCEVELKPEFELPDLKGIEIGRPDVSITDEDVDRYILNQRRIRGRFEPIDGPAEKDDLIVADVVLRSGDEDVKTEENLELGVRPQRLDGVRLEKFGDEMKGVKPGETRKIGCTIADDYERADLRGKPGEFELKVHEIKRLIPVEMQSFLEQSGFESEQEFRDYVRASAESALEEEIQESLRSQILEYLLENTELELPENLSARQTDRAVMRRVVELHRKGVPFADVEAQKDELQTIARKEAVEQLKAQFILDKAAEQLDVQVTDEEVNTVIAQMARRYNRRFDRIRDELRTEGTLGMLSERIRHDKCVDLLLKDAKVSDKPLEKKEKKEKADKGEKGEKADKAKDAEKKEKSGKSDDKDSKPAKSKASGRKPAAKKAASEKPATKKSAKKTAKKKTDK